MPENLKAKLYTEFKSTLMDHKIEASITTKYRYSKLEELHKELLNLAVKDSKEKAEIIASASDSKALNIDYMTFDRYDCEEDDIDFGLCQNAKYEITPCVLSDELKIDKNYETEEVFITWNIK